jgi:hypothetical protein
VHSQETKPERPIWGTLLAIAGAATGVAAFVYFLGAASLWLALKSRGYAADIGIAHEPRGVLIGLGLRGILFIGLLSVILGSAAAVVLLRPGVCDLVRGVRFRWALVLSAALLFGASWTTWRWFALALAVASLVLAVSSRLRFPSFERRWHVAPLVLAAAFTALAWQYGGPVYVDAVRVRPASRLPLRYVDSFSEACPQGHPRLPETWYKAQKVWIAGGPRCLRGLTLTSPKEIARRFKRVCAVPYFGESGSYVYVGEIRHVWEKPVGHCHWSTGPIVELQRDRVLLRFPQRKAQLNHGRNRPIQSAWDGLVAAAKSFD